jgi:hypothetical protein
MNLSPLPIQKFFDNNGRPLVHGLLFTYEAGTTTKIATYKDSSGGTPNTNPIVLDFRGECRLWIDAQQSYKFVLAPRNDSDPPTNPIWSVDNITAAPQAFDNAAVDTGSVNNISLSIPQISSPVAFTRVVFKLAHTNTGPVTLQINGGTAHPVVWQSSVNFSGREIFQNGIYEAVFDGASWQLQGPTLSKGDVRLYGADPTGVNDSTAAIQAALDECAEVILYGTFKASGLQMTMHGQVFRGASRGDGLVAANNTQPIITMTPTNLLLTVDRQIVRNIDFRTGGLSANNTNYDFCAIKTYRATRAQFDSINVGGVFTTCVDIEQSLYSRLYNSNLDGFQKRCVNISNGSSFIRLDNNMLFEASLTSPVEAIVYVSDSASTWIGLNHITRGTGKGIYATGTAPLNQLITIYKNDIDFLENWAIDIDGMWDVRIINNWCAAGQNSTGTPTGQIRVANGNRIIIKDNDTDGALQATSVSIYIDTCSFGEISANTCQYTGDGIVIDSSNYFEVHDNIVGQMTGLPPTGVPMTNCFVGIALVFANHVHWHDNIGYQPTTNIYLNIPATTIQDYQLFSIASGLDGMSPTTDNSTRLGNPNIRWSTVHAASFFPGPGANLIIWTSGAGSPEGVVTAPVGSLYTRNNGGAGTTLYVKETGAANTGWVAK